MASRALLVALVAGLVTVSWLRLESIAVPARDWVPMLVLALAPILAVRLARSRLAAAAVLLATALFAASAAFDVPLADARPRDQRDFFGPVLDGLRQGILDFYETQLPFARLDYPLMHSVVLLAIFGFTAVTGMLVVARRPVPAALAVVAAVGWPATLVPGGNPLRSGTVALVGVLAVLFLLRRGDTPGRGIVQAAGVGALLVAVAVAASTTDAVAKSAFLAWQTWDPYDRPTDPVSVDYVWKANYDGIDFPEDPTTVLRVKVSGAKRQLYWRATTLDDYTGQVWDEDLQADPPGQRDEIDVTGALLPEAAANEDEWVRQDVTVEALRGRHLIGSAQPVRWRPGTDAPVSAAGGGETVVVPNGLRRGQRYTVWSYVPRPKPSELTIFRGDYPDALSRYLEVVYEPVPEWGTRGRDTLMAVFFGAENEDEFQITVLESVYEAARGVTNGARSPYEAAVLLETWFRDVGGFVYDERPPQPLGGEPALVSFVNDVKRGYCQHYAGAMALMLRLLGIPSRVAVGFTSGTYDEDDSEWIVSDTNAHAWVEVWFPRYGWVPFDPTPGRGQLAAPYAVSSGEFNAGDAAGINLDIPFQGISPELAEQIRSAARPGLEGTQGLANPAGGGAAAAVRDRGPSLLGLVLLVVAAAFAAVVVLKAALRSVRFASRDPRRLAAAYRRDLVGFLADQGLDVAPSATLPEIGSTVDRLYAVNADRFVSALTVARFGRPAETRDALRRARRELRDVRRRLRRSLGLPSRVRGAASLRSLGL